MKHVQVCTSSRGYSFLRRRSWRAVSMTISQDPGFRQILSCKGFATGENQDAEIAAKSFGDLLDFMCIHLQHFARRIIELVGEKTMSATHIAHRGDQDVQQTWRERLSQSQFCVTSQQVSHKSIFDER